MNKRVKFSFVIIVILSVSVFFVSCSQDVVFKSSLSQIPSWAIGVWSDSDGIFKAEIRTNEVVLTINNSNSVYLMEVMKYGQGKITITPDSFTIDVHRGDGTNFYKISIKDESSIIFTIHNLGSESSIILYDSSKLNDADNSGDANFDSSGKRVWASADNSSCYKLVINEDQHTGFISIPSGTFSGKLLYINILHDMGGYQTTKYCVVFDIDETDDFIILKKIDANGISSDFNSVDEVWMQLKLIVEESGSIIMNRI